MFHVFQYQFRSAGSYTMSDEWCYSFITIATKVGGWVWRGMVQSGGSGGGSNLLFLKESCRGCNSCKPEVQEYYGVPILLLMMVCKKEYVHVLSLPMHEIM